MILPVAPLTLLAFIPAAVALNLTPGADMMFCLGQGLRGGPQVGMAAHFGIACGGAVQVLLAGLGLGVLVAAQPWAFDAIRWLGVCYLLALAVQAVRGGAVTARAMQVLPVGRVFRQGLLVNLYNPKVILFILAFLPQFVEPARPILPQFLTLGAVFCAGGLVVNGLIGVMAGGIGARLARLSRWLAWLSAMVFAGLALRLAVMQRGAA